MTISQQQNIGDSTNLNNVHNKYIESAKAYKKKVNASTTGISDTKDTLSVSKNNKTNIAGVKPNASTKDAEKSIATVLPQMPKTTPLTIEDKKQALQNISEMILKVKQAVIKLNNELYTIMGNLISSGTNNMSDISKASVSVLAKQIANSKTTINKLKKKIYKQNHKTAWDKIKGFFEKAFKFIDGIMNKIIAGIFGKTIGDKTENWFGKLMKKMFKAINKLAGNLLKKLGLNKKAIAGILDTLDTLTAVEVALMLGPANISLLVDTGGVGVTSLMPGGIFVNAASQGGKAASDYAKNVLNDTALSGKIDIATAAIKGIIQLVSAIVIIVVTAGAGSGVLADDAGNLAKMSGSIDDSASSLEDAEQETSFTEDGSSDTADDDSVDNSDGESSESEETTKKMEEFEIEESQTENTKMKYIAKAKQALSKMKTFMKTGNNITKAVNMTASLASILQGTAGIAVGVKDVSIYKLQKGIANLYKEKASIDSLSSMLGKDISVDQENLQRSKLYMSKISNTVTTLSQGIMTTLTNQKDSISSAMDY